MLNVTLDWSAFDSVIGNLQAPRLNRAVAMGIKDTQNNAKVRAASLIAKQLKAKSEAVKAKIYTPSVDEVHLRGRIEASHNPLRLSEFPSTRWLGRHSAGVDTKAWGGKWTLVPRGFAVSPAMGGTGFVVRRGKARYPLKTLFGPSIWGTFVYTDTVTNAIRERITEQLPRNLARRIKSALRRFG